MTPRSEQPRVVFALIQALVFVSLASFAAATPANKAALEKYYDRFLARDLARCTTCHLPSNNKAPEGLDEFPHNAFGARLRAVGKQFVADGKRKEIPARLKFVAKEDSDGDGVDNETELLLGHNPGDAQDRPLAKELAGAAGKHLEFARFLASYRWQPFDPVNRPSVPRSRSTPRGLPIRNEIDAFIAAEHKVRGLAPRPEAAKAVLLRRAYLDLIGLSPTPAELAAFEKDKRKDAYERVVDRLLADPRYGERWGRHWMDVWRYSDWAGWSGGNQIRDSKPHIWRWRDWIVDSLNSDKHYDRMLTEMLAADEIAPRDTNALRATGFLVRNYKMLSREQWLEDTVKHTSQAFLGLTMGCAKCHDHMYDPVSQAEYYQIRAIFEPHWVRTDHLPGDTNVMTLGLVRVFDTDTNPPTFFFNRGDERKPDTNRLMAPDVPKALGGKLQFGPIDLPHEAGHPDEEEFVREDALHAAEKAISGARVAALKAITNAALKVEREHERELAISLAQARRNALAAVIETERIAQRGSTNAVAWKMAATNAAALQRDVALAEAKLTRQQAVIIAQEAQLKVDAAAEKQDGAAGSVRQVALKKPSSSAEDAGTKASKALAEAKKKLSEADAAVADAEVKLRLTPDEKFKPRPIETYPTRSTGRRLAFARWLASTNNPLTARVAMNQLWLRHFGQGIVPTPQDFGRNGKPPSHPQLLDWLAAEFMANGWSMKAMHRLMVTSSTYRMASTPDSRDASIDPDNVYLWRMSSRRMEAEAVRDNLLYVGGDLDLTMGGPDIDHMLGLKSKRRSIYLRQAAEKEVEFLKIFDGPSVTECYARRPTVVPQQALALANSELTLNEARSLTKRLSTDGDSPAAFARCAFEQVLARHPTKEELKLCTDFLAKEAQGSARGHSRENLVVVLFNHNDFVTIR